MHWLREITKAKLGQVESIGAWQNKNESMKKLLGSANGKEKGKISRKKGKWQKREQKLSGKKEKKEEEEKVGSRIRRRLSAN